MTDSYAAERKRRSRAARAATVKTCVKCGVEKPRKAFYQSKSHLDGYRNECIACYLVVQSARRTGSRDDKPLIPRPDGASPVEWKERGRCRGHEPSTFYPASGEDASTARAICNSGCPVKAECLEWALDHREMGIWSGTSERDRRRLLRLRGRGGAA